MRPKTRFYTPTKVGRRLALSLPAAHPGSVLDPACGDGELLAAAWRRYPGQTRLVGVDVDRAALRKCRARLLSEGVPPSQIHLLNANFLSVHREQLGLRGATYVVTNPPYIAYDRLSLLRRRQARRAAPNLRGRFNFADAFVHACMSIPVVTVVAAILPDSVIRRLQRHHPVSKPSIALKTTTFPATIATAIAVWRPNRLPPPTPQVVTRLASDGVLVRNGVATGADSVFIALADDIRLLGGRTVWCARGRDLQRERITQFPRIWIPGVRLGVSRVPDGYRSQLAARFCVRVKGRREEAFHEQPPSWFLGKSKLILPEIAHSEAYFDDTKGRILPLHSTIAVRAEGSHELLKRVVASPSFWRGVWRDAPVMFGGARRLRAPHVRALVLAGLLSLGWVDQALPKRTPR